MNRHIIALMLVLSVSALAWGDPPEDAATEGTEALSAEEVEAQLLVLIEAIEQAETLPHAVDAYSQAGRLARGDPGINEAYLMKMLEFGQVQNAVYAARWLLRHDPDHGMAWAVLAYFEAENAVLPKALEAAAHAAGQLPDDPGVMQNAGILVAWYEAQSDPPHLPPGVGREIARSKEQWMAHPAFAESYEWLRGDLTEYADRAEAAERELQILQDEMDGLRSDGAVLQEEADLLDYQLYSLSYELRSVEFRIYVYSVQANEANILIADKNLTIRQLERLAPLTPAQQATVDRLKWEIEILAGRDRRLGGRTVAQLRLLAADLREEIRATERELVAVMSELRRMDREYDSLGLEKRQYAAELEAVTEDQSTYLRHLHRDIEWELPLVNGERIDPALARRAASARGDSQPAAEIDAPSSKLQLAKQYVRGGMPAKAIEILQTLIETAPDSSAAAEARVLLAELLAQPPEDETE